MSKSLGNFENLLDFVEQHDPRSFRLLLLQAHYRSPVSVDAELAASAERALAGLDAFARRTADLPPAPADADVLQRFRARMDDDLDTPGAMAVVFDAVRRGNTAVDAGDVATAASLAAAVREVTSAVGLELGRAEDVPADVSARVAELDAARAAKDYATADAIRAELQAGGWIVETTPTGTSVHR
jgi:cysteinyl-tRNA synthetase